MANKHPAVLVTRPPGQGDELCEALNTRGFQAYHQPLLELEPLANLDPVMKQHLLDLDLYHHLIFISANAVHYGMACIDDYWPQLPVGLHWYAVGSSTAALLAQWGMEVQSPISEMTSEGLLSLPSLQQVDENRVLIIKGEGGRNTLKTQLSERGAQVDELACYRRRCPVLAEGELIQKLQLWHIRYLLLSSGEGLQNLLALLSGTETTKFNHIGLIVPSERVAQMAKKAGFERITIAANASNDAMLQALTQWHSGEHSERQ